jgi:hypothetical protein
VNSGQPNEDAFTNQACAELAFAKSMGWDDWTWDEESEEGMVRGYHVQWSADPNAGLVVHDEGDDDDRWVLVTAMHPPSMSAVGRPWVR